MKKTILYLIITILALQLTAFAQNDTVDSAIDDTTKYILSTVQNPEVGSVGGEWSVFGLARSGADVPEAYYEAYYGRVEDYVKSGKLSQAYPTDYARIILTLGAIGKDARSVQGHNLVAALCDSDTVTAQGVNGLIWALIALSSRPYADTDAAKGVYCQSIINAQRADGGWSFDPNAADADPDLTGTALAALAPYRSDSSVSEAIDKGIKYLSDTQTENGGFLSYGSESSESAAQVLTALCALEIPLDDSRFVKNGNTVLDNLLTFYKPHEGFSHTTDDESNQMSTEQCFYALVSAKRSADKANTLYDITDIESPEGAAGDKKIEMLARMIFRAIIMFCNIFI